MMDPIAMLQVSMVEDDKPIELTNEGKNYFLCSLLSRQTSTELTLYHLLVVTFYNYLGSSTYDLNFKM